MRNYLYSLACNREALQKCLRGDIFIFFFLQVSTSSLKFYLVMNNSEISSRVLRFRKKVPHLSFKSWKNINPKYSVCFWRKMRLEVALYIYVYTLLSLGSHSTFLYYIFSASTFELRKIYELFFHHINKFFMSKFY